MISKNKVEPLCTDIGREACVGILPTDNTYNKILKEKEKQGERRRDLSLGRGEPCPPDKIHIDTAVPWRGLPTVVADG